MAQKNRMHKLFKQRILAAVKRMEDQLTLALLHNWSRHRAEALEWETYLNRIQAGNAAFQAILRHELNRRAGAMMAHWGRQVRGLRLRRRAQKRSCMQMYHILVGFEHDLFKWRFYRWRWHLLRRKLAKSRQQTMAARQATGVAKLQWASEAGAIRRLAGGWQAWRHCVWESKEATNRRDMKGHVLMSLLVQSLVRYRESRRH